MTPSAWIALGFGSFGVVLNVAVLAMGYGAFKGQFQGAMKRIETLEAELSALSELKVSVAELKTSMTFMIEQFKDLNASIRWMREPAPSEPVRPASRSRASK